jgi:hypothetical protein
VNLETIAFKPSAPLTIGVELELQLVNTRDCDSHARASDMLALIEKNPASGGDQARNHREHDRGEHRDSQPA